MKNFFILIIFYLLVSCESVSKKIDDKVTQEEVKLSKWLNQSETELKVAFGKPDEIKFKDNSNNRFYVYTTKKYNIKCERIFELDARNIVVGYTSKNCF